MPVAASRAFIDLFSEWVCCHSKAKQDLTRRERQITNSRLVRLALEGRKLPPRQIELQTTLNLKRPRLHPPFGGKPPKQWHTVHYSQVDTVFPVAVLSMMLSAAPNALVRGTSGMLAGQLALIAAALFAGAAIYINIAEQPDRLDLGDKALFTEWRSTYKRGFAMQAPLALVGSVLSLLACWRTNDWRWLVGAVVLIANWPYTLFAIMPTNKQLKAINSASAGSRSRMLIEKWGRLHVVRSALGFAATLICLWASLS